MLTLLECRFLRHHVCCKAYSTCSFTLCLSEVYLKFRGGTVYWLYIVTMILRLLEYSLVVASHRV